MTTEQQCLTMARDQGDDCYNITPGKSEIKSICDKYTTRDSVVEAIKNRIIKDNEFAFKLNLEIKEFVIRESCPLFVAPALLSAAFLRKAYLRASGLWVEELNGDKASPTQKWKAQEEVVLPTKDNYVYWSYRDNSGEWQHVQSTPKAAADTLMKLSKELKIFEDHHKAIMEELAEARRGL